MGELRRGVEVLGLCCPTCILTLFFFLLFSFLLFLFFFLYLLPLSSFSSDFGFSIGTVHGTRKFASAAGFSFCVRVWEYVLDGAKAEILQVSERVYSFFRLKLYFSFVVFVLVLFRGHYCVRLVAHGLSALYSLQQSGSV